MQRRTVELDGAFEHGMVAVPVEGKGGRTKLEDAPATEENIREALAYWVARKPRSESARTAQNEHVSTLTRRLEAMRSASVVVHAPVDAPVTTEVETVPAPCDASMGVTESPTGERLSPEGRTSQMSPGPALVKGRSEAPLAGEVTVRQAGEEYTRPAPVEDSRRNDGGTWAAPTGRDRMDKESSTVPIVGGTYGYLTGAQYEALSRSQQRKYWERIKKQKAYAKAHRGTQTRVPVKLGTGGMGSSSFADGDSRETERVMRQPKS
jgi:hypothetical protein